MDISEKLLREQRFQKEAAIAMANKAASGSETFAELMNCFLSPEYRLSQRAAWCVSFVADAHPQLVKPYLNRLVKLLFRNDVHPAVIRNSLRILQKVEVPEKLHGSLMQACFTFLESVTSPVAIKSYAIAILEDLSKQYPDIIPELKLLIEDKIVHEKPAFVSRAKSALKTWEKMQQNK